MSGEHFPLWPPEGSRAARNTSGRLGTEYRRHSELQNLRRQLDLLLSVYSSLIAATGKCYDAVVATSVLYLWHVVIQCSVQVAVVCELFSSSGPVGPDWL